MDACLHVHTYREMFSFTKKMVAPTRNSSAEGKATFYSNVYMEAIYFLQ